MKRSWVSLLLLWVGTTVSHGAEFRDPVRLLAGDSAIRVESPGFAAPGWANVNGQGRLFVGQFNQGKIQVFKHLGEERFAPGEWLKVEGAVAEVPGVW